MTPLTVLPSIVADLLVRPAAMGLAQSVGTTGDAVLDGLCPTAANVPGHIGNKSSATDTGTTAEFFHQPARMKAEHGYRPTLNGYLHCVARSSSTLSTHFIYTDPIQ